MELYYKEERDRDLFRAYNEALKSLGKMAVNVPREQIVRHVVYSIAPRFYISYDALCTILAEKRAPRFYLSERSALLTIYRMQKGGVS